VKLQPESRNKEIIVNFGVLNHKFSGYNVEPQEPDTRVTEPRSADNVSREGGTRISSRSDAPDGRI
jgi:hypothetical protein